MSDEIYISGLYIYVIMYMYYVPYMDNILTLIIRI